MADNPIKYSDLISPDDSIDNLIKKLGTLIVTYDGLYETVMTQSRELASAMKSVSGATSDGRKKIAEASKEADKLAKAQQALRDASSETAAEIARLKEATREQNRINAANAKQALATKGSYNDLSAQYTKIKIELDKLGDAERQNTKYGQDLEKQSKELADKMNELQKATGKYTLQVGNYTIAGESMKNVILQGKEALRQMAQAGKQNSKEYQELADRLSKFYDQSTDVDAQIKAMASDTFALDATLQAMAVGTGGFAVVTGAMELFGGESEKVEEAQRKLQAAIALVNGVTAIQNALQKQSALVQGLKSLQTKILTKFTSDNTKQTVANTAAVTAQATATKGATAATTGFGKALNALKANPIIAILAVLAAAVAGAIALVDHIKSKQKEAYEEELRMLELTEEKRKIATQGYEKNISDIEQKIKVAQAEGKSEEEILKLREDQFAQQTAMAKVNTVWNKDAIDNLEKNKKKLAENNAALKANELEGKNRIKLGKYEREEIEAQNALLERQIEIAEQQMETNKDLAVQAATLAEERRQLAIKTAEAEEDAFRNLQDARFRLIQNQFTRERATTKAQYDRQIADLQTRLTNERNLTEKQRKYMNALIIELDKEKQQQLKEITKQETQANYEAIQATENMRLNLMEQGSAKAQAQLLSNYNAQKKVIEDQLKEEGKLTVTQKEELNNQLILLEEQYNKDTADLARKRVNDTLTQELKGIELRRAALVGNERLSTQDILREIEIRRQQELIANSQLAVELRQDEAAINAKYDAERIKAIDAEAKDIAMHQLEIQQNLASSEIDIMRTSEKKKTTLRLQLEAERLQKILDLDKEANIKMSEEERKTIENQLKKTQQDIKRNEVPTDLYEVLGLDLTDEEKEGFNQSLQYAKDAISQFLDYRLQVSQQTVDAANREVEAAQNVLNTERAARAAGYANNVEMAEKELAAAKAQQRKALKQQQETQKAQQKMQTIEQALNMVTATAKIFGTMPFYLAIPAVALMWGVFAASKIKANQLKSEQYGEGTVELLQGGSHQSGNDIDLGRKKDGTRRRAEGGEFFAVINKKSSRKYRKQIPDIINSLNKGTFTEKYASAFDGGTAVIAQFDGKAELTSIAKDMREINDRQKATNIIYTMEGRIEKRGNVTRIVRNN